MDVDDRKPRINWGKVVAGGLVAGVVFNVGGMTIAGLLDLPRTFARMGLQPSSLTLFIHLGTRFGFGLVSVFLYAAMRPRFGPGPRTAAVAGAVLWLCAEIPLIMMMGELHALSAGQALVGAGWGWLEATAAALVGGWLYREE